MSITPSGLWRSIRDVAQGLLPVQAVGEKGRSSPRPGLGIGEEVVTGLGDDCRIGRRFGHLWLGIDPAMQVPGWTNANEWPSCTPISTYSGAAALVNPTEQP